MIRDSLAAAFVKAAHEDPTAAASLADLARWCEGDGAPGGPRERLHNERGEPIFGPDGELHPDYAPHAAYVRDRALRMQAALGWLREGGALGRPLEAARAAWDAGLFFEVHELLEPLWLAEQDDDRKRALQGLILAGAGLYHLTGDNLAGARGLLGDAERRLQESPRLDGLDLATFGAQLGDLGRAIREGRLQHWSELGELPRF